MEKSLFTDPKNRSITISNDLLIAAKWPKLKVAEQRIVIWLLWKVKPEDEDFRDYIIPVKEIAEIMNFENKISGNLYREFDKATDGLMKKVIKWPAQYGYIPSSKKCHWCSFIEMIPGEGKVILRFDKSLKPFIVNLKKNFTNLGDIKILLRLKNHYSFRMYHLLKYHQGISTRYNKEKSFVIELSELKDFLGIEEDRYKRYQDFKRRILTPSLEDIENNAGFKIEVSISQRKNRKIHALEFNWNDLVEYIDDDSDDNKNEYHPFVDILKYEFGVAGSNAITLFEQYETDHIAAALDAAREYIDNKQSSGKPITNPAGVARKAIEEGWKTNIKNYVNPVKEEEKRKKEAEEQTKAEEQAQREKEEHAKAEKRAEKLYDRYIKLSDDEQDKILQAFLKDKGTPVCIVRNYEKYGLKHPSVYWVFIPFLEKFWEVNKK